MIRDGFFYQEELSAPWAFQSSIVQLASCFLNKPNNFFSCGNILLAAIKSGTPVGFLDRKEPGSCERTM